MIERAINTSTHAVDLSDGRTVQSGQEANDIPENPHNRALLTDGTLCVVGSEEPPEPEHEQEPDDDPVHPTSMEDR